MSASRAQGRRTLVFGVLLLLLSLFTTIQLVVFNVHLSSSLQCQANFNNRVSAVIADRANLADEDRQNLSDLVTGVVNAHSGADAETALEKYLSRKADIDAKRTQVPVPTIKEVQSCG